MGLKLLDLREVVAPLKHGLHVFVSNHYRHRTLYLIIAVARPPFKLGRKAGIKGRAGILCLEKGPLPNDVILGRKALPPKQNEIMI